MISILSAAALAIAPPVAVESAAQPVMYEVAPNVWSDQPGPLLTPPPPTEQQAECLARWSKRDDAANVLDLASTGIVVAMGGAEVGLASLAGPAWPVAVIALKLFSRSTKKAAIRGAYVSGDYDKVCTLLKARSGITAGAVAFNVIGAM